MFFSGFVGFWRLERMLPFPGPLTSRGHTVQGCSWAIFWGVPCPRLGILSFVLCLLFVCLSDVWQLIAGSLSGTWKLDL